MVPRSPTEAIILVHYLHLIIILLSDVFYTLAVLNHKKAYGLPVLVKNCASVLEPCLTKLFQLCLTTSTFPSYWKFA